MEINQKYNRDITESLFNTAIGMLMQNEIITEKDFSSISVNLGYLFSKEDGELESLYKINAGGRSYYFALQNGSLMAVDIDEDMYQGTISKMEEMHPCLLSDELPETDLQKARRERNNEIISGMGISTSDRLMTRWEDSDVVLKDKETLCRRALACFQIIQIACDINNGNYEEALGYFGNKLEALGLTDALNDKERAILDGSYEMQDVYDLAWAYEAYWALCWCLGLVDDISEADNICDCDAAIEFADVESVQDFAKKCELRSKEEILDMLDLYFRYNWVINDFRVNRDASIGDLNPSVVIERRRGLEWAVSADEDWYDMDMDA